jgi:hypothetical protein
MEMEISGRHPAVLVDVETESGPLAIQFGPATKSSPFQAIVTFEIVRGPFSGQRISAWLYFGTDKADKRGKTVMDRSLEALRACGFTGDDLDKFTDQHPDQEVELTIEMEEYEGKRRAKVKWINPPNRGGFVLDAPLAHSDLRKFSAQLKGALKKAPVIQGKKAERQAPTPMPAGAASDDAPAWDGMDQDPGPPVDDPFA